MRKSLKYADREKFRQPFPRWQGRAPRLSIGRAVPPPEALETRSGPAPASGKNHLMGRWKAEVPLAGLARSSLRRHGVGEGSTQNTGKFSDRELFIRFPTPCKRARSWNSALQAFEKACTKLLSTPAGTWRGLYGWGAFFTFTFYAEGGISVPVA